jgi:hypothetical protein
VTTFGSLGLNLKDATAAKKQRAVNAKNFMTTIVNCETVARNPSSDFM